MRLVRDNEAAADIVHHETGQWPPPWFAGYLVMDESETIRGVVTMTQYTAGANIEVSAIGRKCWSAGIVRKIARICFETFECRRVSAKTRKSNAVARDCLKRLGFREEGALREFYADGETAILFGLLRREQRLVKV